MSAPEKRGGFSQGLYAISATAKEQVGTKRTLQDGRVFRYAKAGASDLAPGQLHFMTQAEAEYNRYACPVAAAGAMQLTLTIGTASPAILANELENGIFIISEDAGIGEVYPIASNSAVLASGTSMIISLREKLRTALTTSAYYRILPNPWWKSIATATEENVPAGTSLVTVTALYYYWSQTKGIGAGRLQMKRDKAYATMTLTVGMKLIPSVCSGYLEMQNTSGVPTYNPGKPIVATYTGIANVLSAYVLKAFPVIWCVEQ
jgi:hypothetical protein